MKGLLLGAAIEIEDSGQIYHTIDDWGLVITNNDYISEPAQETKYIDVPGRDGLLDVSEAVSGRRIFKQRSIQMELGGIRERRRWDNVISDFRNKIHGKIVHIVFDNDIAFFWKGRAYVNGFDRVRKTGTFTLSLPQADPYKYEIEQSTEPWKWDPFSFETGVIKNAGNIIVDGTKTVTVPRGSMPVSPVFLVSDIKSDAVAVSTGKTAYNLIDGSNRFPDILVNGEDETELVFEGRAVISIVYRGGSL